MFNPQLWCNNNFGIPYTIPDTSQIGCRFPPATNYTTINNIYYDKTPDNNNLKGWLPSRTLSNLQIGKDPLYGESIIDYKKFNLAQTQFCNIKPFKTCHHHHHCYNKYTNNYYCWNNKCYTKDYPVSIITQHHKNNKLYGNIPIYNHTNLTSDIYHFTDYYFKDGEITDGSEIRCQ